MQLPLTWRQIPQSALREERECKYWARQRVTGACVSSCIFSMQETQCGRVPSSRHQRHSEMSTSPPAISSLPADQNMAETMAEHSPLSICSVAHGFYLKYLHK
ncbi:hypothetical protein SRHO_G00155810 [Serrasalmus rhombeus]